MAALNTDLGFTKHYLPLAIEFILEVTIHQMVIYQDVHIFI